jgi:hypothetical protein
MIVSVLIKALHARFARRFVAYVCDFVPHCWLLVDQLGYIVMSSCHFVAAGV